MAFGTNFHLDIRPGGADKKIMAAGACDGGFRIGRMNFCFHGSGELPVMLDGVVHKFDYDSIMTRT